MVDGRDNAWRNTPPPLAVAWLLPWTGGPGLWEDARAICRGDRSSPHLAVATPKALPTPRLCKALGPAGVIIL